VGIMQAVRSVPVERGWTSQEDIDEGMGFVQLYPGAIMVDIITYIGYRLRGVRGALMIGALALSPGSAKPAAAQQAGRAPVAMSISWSRLALATVPGLVVVAGTERGDDHGGRPDLPCLQTSHLGP